MPNTERPTNRELVNYLLEHGCSGVEAASIVGGINGQWEHEGVHYAAVHNGDEVRVQYYRPGGTGSSTTLFPTTRPRATSDTTSGLLSVPDEERGRWSMSETMLRQSIDTLRARIGTGTIVPLIPSVDEQEVEARCDDCDHLCPEEDLDTINERRVCHNCADDYYHCNGCDALGREYARVEGGSHYCNECFSADYHACCICGRGIRDSEERELCNQCCAEPARRPFNPSKPNPKSFKSGKIIKSPRLFGIEIECLVPRQDAGQATRELPDGVGVGYDGSIHGNGEAIEIRSPILHGAAGESIVQSMTSTIRKYDGYVNNSCGLHVHLDCQGIDNPVAIQKLMAFYIVFDDIITAMLPKYRRGNHYARSMKSGYSLREVLDCSPGDIAAKWYKTTDERRLKDRMGSQRQDTRYQGINFHRLFRGETLEIRYHSPTLSPKKILSWVALHQKIVDSVVKLPLSTIGHASDIVSPYLKLTEMTKLIKADKTLKKYITGRIDLFNNKMITKLCAA